MNRYTSITYLDLLQIYNLTSGRDLNDIVSIFNDADIDERVDKGILAGTILDTCGAMRPIYNTSPTFKFFSDNFFARNKEAISRVLDTLEVQYNPLESINVHWTETTDISQNLDTTEDRTEDRTKNNTGSQTKNNTGTQTKNNTGTQTKTDTGTETTTMGGSETTTNTGTKSETSGGTEDNTVSAMNDSNYQPDSHKTVSGNNTVTDNLTETLTKELTDATEKNLTEQITDDKQETVTDDKQETVTDDKQETIQANNNATKNEQLVWGETDTHNETGSKNYAYQDLIQKELKIRNFSIYSWIANKYAKEMFLLVY